jgi:diketogulonate reductase-like aldo/keto reductase
MITRPFGATGVEVAVVGQGTWGMGESRRTEKDEVAALRLGIELGMTHIDTAEAYAEGGAERVVGRAVDGRRLEVFITTKVWPDNASYAETLRACEQSLQRLRTDSIDLYLLHWPSRHPIHETMRAMEELVRRGRVRFIGVSNFDVTQLQAAQAALKRERLACNQVLYHLRDRKIERDLLPYCEKHDIAVVGYTPLAKGGFHRGVVADVARKHGRTPCQVALNFLTRRPCLFTIPKASQPAHVRENAAALDFTLSPEDLKAIGQATAPTA